MIGSITDDKDFFYVEMMVELDSGEKVCYATISIRKPCPLRTLEQRAEAFLSVRSQISLPEPRT